MGHAETMLSIFLSFTAPIYLNKIAGLQAKVANIRKNALHKIMYHLAQKYG